MLQAAIVLAVLAVIFSVLGFSGLASGFGSVAYLLAIVFAVLFVVSMVINALKGSTRSLI